MSTLTVRALFEAHRQRLRLTWEAGQAGGDLAVAGPAERGAPPDSLVGHLTLIRPNRIQVLGSSELRYLDGLGKNSYDDALTRLFGERPAAIIVCDGRRVNEDIIARAEAAEVPVLRSGVQSLKLISYLQHYLITALAEKTTLHGVFMSVSGIGVLITGSSGVGKSELALELLSRGHQLVADDAPELARISPDTLCGTCPELLRGFLEVRGLGILDVRAIFGDNAVKQSKNLRLIINLERHAQDVPVHLDRLRGTQRNRTLLEVDVPEILLPVTPGSNLAVLAETAVRDHILRFHGHDATEEFIARQRRLMQRDNPA
ncbi:HPr(Ser) kinase/phosphatase [Ectothiorhodospiraceae bacterium 2226]|nr:HPr(Ser) kinase/phosphatase [Ectothiorhodospiraceae bacterium 2226]